MKVWISTWIKPLIITWRYDVTRKGQVVTTCTIRAKDVKDPTKPGWDLEFKGVCFQHKLDAFDKERGRKLSLARAMQSVMSRDERREVWEQYFGRMVT